MSGNSITAAKREDPRPRQSRDLLGDALVALIEEKAFDEITVQQVLDRAGVGRTTFYKHYRDKQDLFLSDVEDFLEGIAGALDRMGAPPARIAPVAELFAHVAEKRELFLALTAAGKMVDIRELGTGIFARAIARRLSAAGSTLHAEELRATAHALAGALFSMLDWWLAERNELSAAAMDAQFHRLTGLG